MKHHCEVQKKIKPDEWKDVRSRNGWSLVVQLSCFFVKFLWFDIKKSDELDRYLVMEMNKPSLSNDPLEFWKAQSENMPFLSRYAKQIHSIPATAASVERQFSAAGLVLNDRRTNLNPNHLDNILLIRPLNRMKWHVPRPVVHSIWIYLFSMIVRKHF